MQRIFFISIILLSLVNLNCRSREDKTIDDARRDSTSFDLRGSPLLRDDEMTTDLLISAGVIDTTRTPELSETAYADTIVHLNDSIYYGIVHVGDKAGICSILFITTVRKADQKVIESRYLYPDCDIDYSNDTYDYFDHRLASANNIILTRTTVTQKKDRIPGNETENIERQEKKHTYLFISERGQLVFEEEPEEH